jgi:single-strand DNA-binding protein
MASHNRVILLGNVTRDIEVKYLQSGTAVTEMGMAVNDRRKNQQGEWVDEVTFVDVTLWGRTAEIAGEYLSKGSPVFIEGRLKLDTWEKDGKKNYKLRVVGERLQLIGGRPGAGGGRGPAGQPHYEGEDYGEPEPASAPRGAAPARAPQSAAPPPGDDIPF